MLQKGTVINMALIYIVEDDNDILEVETFALKNSNYEVKGFTNAKDFYAAVEEKVPSLAVLDVMLPDEDGLQIVQNIRHNPRAAHVPVIMVTARTTEIDKVKEMCIRDRSMIGGLALFLYGMHIMSEGLEKVSGGRLEKVLENLTSSKWKAVLLGAGVTAVIQSSSATTVMVVGFVNSGIMKLSQAIGIIMGANVGTTITSWLLSLTGIQGDNILLQLLKPSSFSPVLALIGIILVMFIKDSKKKDIGRCV